MAEREVEGQLVTCPWHGWQWDVTNGAGCTNPGAKLDCFRVEVVGDDLFVTV
jgi:nitrite reductase/ring-hydroxylating ferredoxin subunit